MDEDLIFCDPRGSTLKPYMVSKRFSRTVREAGMPLRFHDLRHISASLLLRAGIPSKVVAERLGHSSSRVTDDIYSHVLPDTQDQAAIALDSLMSAPVAAP